MDCSICSHADVVGGKITQEDMSRVELISILEKTEGYTLYQAKFYNRNITVVSTILDVTPFLKPTNVVGYWVCQDKSSVILYDTDLQPPSSSGSEISLVEAVKICPYNLRHRVQCKKYGSREEISELTKEQLDSITLGELLSKSGTYRIYKGNYMGKELLLKYFQRETLDYNRFEKELCIQHTVNLAGFAPKVHAYWHCKDDWSIVVLENINGKTIKSVIETESTNVPELYLQCIRLVLILNLELNISFGNINLENLILSNKDIKIIDFSRANYGSEPLRFTEALEKPRIIQDDLNELLNSDSSEKPEYMFFIDIPRLTSHFLSVLGSSPYSEFHQKLQRSLLSDINTIFLIYKYLYSQGKFDLEDILIEIKKLIS